MITNPRFTTNPLCELNLTEDQISNSLFQQIMSKFKPNKFSIYKELDSFIPRSQLEKLVVANLKKHKKTGELMTKGSATRRHVSNSKKYLK